jgi:outer membrane protein TolC
VPVAYQVATGQPNPVSECEDPFAGQSELAPGPLVEEVLRRNPSLSAMVAAWQAAAERYPQAVSLEDPMLSTMVGPGTFGDPKHDVAWMIGASQKLPWPGKRQLRGDEASAEASAARMDVGDAELRLVELTKLALADYYLARRERQLNDENLRALQEFREIALAKYRANLVTQQDVLQSELELAELKRRALEIVRMESVAVARLNTLLHRPPNLPLPAPPALLATDRPTPSPDLLRQLAVDRRPDLSALGERVRAEQAAVELACRDYYPDLELSAKYDGFWQGADRQLAPAVGVNLNVPLDNERRRAAVREAEFRLNQRRAEYEAKRDTVLSEVQIAGQQLEESRRVVQLYRDELVTAGEQNLASARIGYTANRIDFLRLIDADRQLLMIRDKYQEAVVENYRRHAELERIIAGPLPGALRESSEEVAQPGR